MALKNRLKDQAINALAALHGAADETTFGGTTWAARKIGLGDELEQLEKENPWATTSGRVGSYFVPGAGWVKLATKLPKAGGLVARGAQAASRGVDAMQQGYPALAKILQFINGPGWKNAVAGGAVKGVAAGEGQHLMRKMTGTSDDTGQASSTADRLLSETVFGMGGGALGNVLQKVAPVVYNHPALLNIYDRDRSEKLTKELLDEGVWGRLPTFKAKAQSMKDAAKPRFDDIQDKVRRREAALSYLASQQASAALNGFPVPMPKGGVDVRGEMGKKLKAELNKWGRSGVSGAEKDALGEAYSSAARNMRPDKYGLTNVDELTDSLYETNDRLSKLNARDQARRSGAQGLGENSAEIDRVASLKGTYEDMYKRRMRAQNQHNLVQDYEDTKVLHGKGADILRNIQAHEILNQQGSGRLFNDAWRNVIDRGAASPGVRTGLGVGLNKAAPRLMSTVPGRTAELRSRRSANKEEEPIDVEALPVDDESSAIDPNNPFLEDLPPEALDGAKPIDHPDVEASRKKLWIKKADLEAVRNMPKRRATSEEWRVEEEDEENPFLQDLLMR